MVKALGKMFEMANSWQSVNVATHEALLVQVDKLQKESSYLWNECNKAK